MKDHLVSVSQTFLATFLTTIGALISVIPTETLANPQTYTRAFFVGILISAVRQTVKVLWQKTLPEKIGGVKKGD